MSFADKLKWPELVGSVAEDAKAKINSERSELNVIILPPGSMVIKDFRPDRVWLCTDSENKVNKVPKVG